MYGGNEGIAPPFLTSPLDGGEWTASRPYRFTPREKSPKYALDRRLSGPQSRSGRCGVEKNDKGLEKLEKLFVCSDRYDTSYRLPK
jgi:hypothetical protein